ncbi:CpaD family pilus assembly protein [Oceanibacterium hippocampi]|uniref:Pilus biogenesis CpaD protein (Pilus_cpaD) n=1 Tax=Oceanibacterium hippocampi TaxID=745714 RepID=A0A1Y5SC54_9PROT|nr:CpaD family pilus assembly lipoprotein [Oceanibacterium hippocampi]SLN36607.1 Pilus biogenesis CpaD protein (pilus_cpaD) [Oceanibacterium hippocampi]
MTVNGMLSNGIGAPLRAATIALALFALAGCETEAERKAPPVSAEKPIEVLEIEAVHQVAFAAGTNAIGPEESARLDDFLARMRVRFGDRVDVEAPPAGAPADLAHQRFAALMAALEDRGARPVARRTVQQSAAGLRLFYSRHVATTIDCPGWSGDSETNFKNQITPRVGCTTAANLAAMVDDPRDLVQGRPGNATEAERLARAVRIYRAGGSNHRVVSSGSSSGSGGSSDSGSSSGGSSSSSSSE